VGVAQPAVVVRVDVAVVAASAGVAMRASRPAVTIETRTLRFMVAPRPCFAPTLRGFHLFVSLIGRRSGALKLEWTHLDALHLLAGQGTLITFR